MTRQNDGRWAAALALAVALLGTAPAAAQWADSDETAPGAPSPAAQKFKELTESATAKKDKDKDKIDAPFDFFRTRVAPFDTLPFVKAGHWSTVTLELRANLFDYEGRLQTPPIRLLGMPQAVVFRREARLTKGQSAQLTLQVLLPETYKEMTLDLARPDAIRPDEGTQAPLRRLEVHQMVIPVLARDPIPYAKWGQFLALRPASGSQDGSVLERRRYYRMSTLQEPEKPLVSGHPLAWTTTSHVIWDDYDPGALSPAQHRAMLDWLHWGGQLIIVGGASRTLALVADRESFLGPYLPAEPSGENSSLTEDDLRDLGRAYPPPIVPDPAGEIDVLRDGTTTFRRPTARYRAPEAIRPERDRPVFLAGLRLRDGATVTEFPLGDGSGRLLGVEGRVGRGRILMLGFNPNDPALVKWAGLDTLVRRLVLRRPEDPTPPSPDQDDPGSMLAGPDLSWVRFLGRDLGAVGVGTGPDPALPPGYPGSTLNLPDAPVAAWLDNAALPSACREALGRASGISIPAASFVLKVLLAYVVALVPINWVLCRYVLRRREWAWVLVPLLALGFAVAVERAAAFDLGFDSACDEIDVLELQEGYPRAHLSRFAALYSTGRVRYAISYPQDPQALALPLNTNLGVRGEDIAESAWQSSPMPPGLVGFQVQPRSLAMFRAEQMVDVKGAIELDTTPGRRRVLNGTDLELRDAVLLDVGTGRETPLGTIG
ncbi:MAG TPA: hypothetical protein VF590_16250, partial [Isosphaeraceae bacterium]